MNFLKKNRTVSSYNQNGFPTRLQQLHIWSLASWLRAPFKFKATERKLSLKSSPKKERAYDCTRLKMAKAWKFQFKVRYENLRNYKLSLRHAQSPSFTLLVSRVRHVTLPLEIANRHPWPTHGRSWEAVIKRTEEGRSQVILKEANRGSFFGSVI